MPKKYEVIVSCERNCPVLRDEEVIRRALRDKIKGQVFLDILIGCPEEVAGVSLERSFLLTEKSDIQPLKDALVAIGGVIEIRNGHVWSVDKKTG